MKSRKKKSFLVVRRFVTSGRLITVNRLPRLAIACLTNVMNANIENINKSSAERTPVIDFCSAAVVKTVLNGNQRLFPHAEFHCFVSGMA